MKTDQLYLLIISILFILISACSPKNDDETPAIAIPSGPREICDTTSIWRDHNGVDSCSFYSEDQRCKQIIGRFNVITRLHKGALEKDIFGGGQSSRWYEIEESRIRYYKPNGDVADEGNCNCKDGILSVKWESSNQKTVQYQIYFNTPDQLELRYFDYPFDFNTFQYDSTKRANNPTKILGVMEH